MRDGIGPILEAVKGAVFGFERPCIDVELGPTEGFTAPMNAKSGRRSGLAARLHPLANTPVIVLILEYHVVGDDLSTAGPIEPGEEITARKAAAP